MLLNVGIILILLAHGCNCKDKKPAYINHDENFRNMAVSGNHVFIGGNNSFIYRLTPSLELIGTTFVEGYPTNWLISANGDVINVCNYKQDYGTTCFIQKDGDIIGFKTTSIKIGKPVAKYITTTINNENLLWIATSSCLYNEVYLDCQAISMLRDNGKFYSDDNRLYRVNYKEHNQHVNFKTVLQHDNFVYFLFSSNQTHSKLGKMCYSTDDSRRMNSYEDIFITCNTGYKNYTTVKDALFWNDDLLVVFVDTSTSIICLFTLTNVNMKFRDSRQQRLSCPYTDPNKIFQKQQIWPDFCYNKTTLMCENPYHMRSFSCPEVNSQNGSCSLMFFGSVEGNIHLIQNSVVYQVDRGVTGLVIKIAAAGIRTDAILYVGTDTGKVGKIFMNREESKILGQFKTVQHLSPILDIKVHGEKVYVLTENMIVNIANQESCQTALTCEECMKSENTGCGWNLLKKICSKMDNSTTWWLPSAGGRCLTIVSSDYLILEQTNSAQPENIIVTFKLAPVIEFSGSVQCEDDNNVYVEAVRSENDLQCSMRVGEDPLSFNLIVESITVATATINLYKCSNSKSCNSCVNRRQCSWCLNTSSCVENSTECTSQKYSNSLNLVKCPGLQSTEVFISKGREEDLRLEVTNLDEFTHTSENLRCVVGQETYLARLEDGNKQIVCLGVTTFSNQNITVQYKGVNLDNTAKLEVYDCRDLNSCGSCQYYGSRGYRCLWCGNCQSSQDRFGECQESRKNCKISLTDIYPKAGPMLGGTKVTIYGYNIGNPFDNITVTINGIACSNVTVLKPSESIRCVTGRGSTHSNSAIITTVNGISVLKEHSHFIYKDQIVLLQFTPNTSIIAGGRKIRIFGQNIGYDGSTYEISFCNNRNCVSCRLIEVIKDDGIWCEIQSLNMSATMTQLNVTIDHNTQITLNQQFQVFDNPMMLAMSPEFTTVIRSGGSKITITGSRFQNVGEVNVDNVETPCLILSDTNVVCEAPPYVKSDFERRKRATGQNIYVYFDNYKSLLKVHYVDDPIFVEPQNLIDYEIDPRLVLVKGMNLLLGARVDDFVVHIGLDGTCRIVEITNDNLTCFAPYTIPKTNLTDRHTASIVVQVGRMRTYLGIIRYSSEDDTRLRNYAIISVLTGLIICAIVGIVVGTIVKQRTMRKLETHAIQMNEMTPNTQMSSNNGGYEISDGEGILDQYHQYSGMEDDANDRSGYDDLGIRSQDNPYERLEMNTQVDS